MLILSAFDLLCFCIRLSLAPLFPGAAIASYSGGQRAALIYLLQLSFSRRTALIYCRAALCRRSAQIATNFSPLHIGTIIVTQQHI